MRGPDWDWGNQDGEELLFTSAWGEQSPFSAPLSAEKNRSDGKRLLKLKSRLGTKEAMPG